MKNIRLIILLFVMLGSAMPAYCLANSFTASIQSKSENPGKVYSMPLLLTGHEKRANLHKNIVIKKNYFPEKFYSIPNVFFKINHAASSANFNGYDVFVAHATLRLISYDKLTGAFRYSLELTPISILSSGPTVSTSKSFKKINGTVKFNSNNELATFIDGKVKFVAEEAVLSQLFNQHKSQDFILQNWNQDKSQYILTSINNASVTVSVTSEF